MLLLVHTITMTVDELEVSARFYHTVSQLSQMQRVRLALVGQQMAVMRRNKLGPCKLSSKHRLSRPHFRQSLRAVALRGSVSVEQRSPLRAVVSSANAEQPTSSQACQPLHLVPANGRALAAPPSDAIAITNNLELGLSRTANVQQANAWLQNNRFSAFLRTFSNFSGLDLLRLSCDNLIQICGLPEGIRLFNALHRSPLAACLTLYMCLESSPEEVYEAVFLESLTSAELSRKLAALLGAQLPPSAPTPRLLLQGPAGIHVAVSDQVVTNMKDEAIYMLQVIQGQADQFCLLLKPVNRTR